MNLKITYIKDAPMRKRPNRYQPLQAILSEFMNSNYPAVQIDYSDHYANLTVMYSSFSAAIKRSGYPIRIWIDREKNASILNKDNKLPTN